jgi:hypothetical protein
MIMLAAIAISAHHRRDAPLDDESAPEETFMGVATFQ